MNLMPTTPILSPAEYLAETAGERAALRTALTLLELCAPSAPDAVVQYASERYHEAAQPTLVAATLVDSARVEVEMLRVTGEQVGTGFIPLPDSPSKPEIPSGFPPGITSVRQHRIKG